MTTELLTQRQGTSLILTLSGPATRNSLSPQVHAAGLEMLNVAESDDAIRSVVITGAGGHFCGGGDVQRLAQNRVDDLAQQGRNIEAFHQWIEALRCFPKPVLAAVEGVVAGGGLSLMMACDLVISADSARFVSAYSRIGVTPDGGLSWHLGRAMSRGQALLWLWTGGERSAQQLHAWEMVHQLVPAGQAQETALELAETLAQAPAGVVAGIKELVHAAAAQPLDTHLAQEKQQFLHHLVQAEAGHAMDRFLQGSSAHRRDQPAGR